jgi:hypothetical protein
VHGPLNSDCLGPDAVWAKHSCARNPQVIPGVPSVAPISAECMEAVDAKCKASSPPVTGSVFSHACDDCLAGSVLSLGCVNRKRPNSATFCGCS